MNRKTQENPVLQNLDRVLPDLGVLYKDIHAHPELSMQETRTAGVAAERLRANGYDVTTGIGNNGVVGLLRNGEGPVVMLRADIDALPVKEATGLPYASMVTSIDHEGKTVPVAHACGHDIHVAWLERIGRDWHEQGMCRTLFVDTIFSACLQTMFWTLAMPETAEHDSNKTKWLLVSNLIYRTH